MFELSRIECARVNDMQTSGGRREGTWRRVRGRSSRWGSQTRGMRVSQSTESEYRQRERRKECCM